MDELTAEELTEIENFAYCYMLRPEIALLVGTDITLISDIEHPAGIAFVKGRLRRKAEFNMNLIQLSKQLSSPAMQIEAKLSADTYLNDIKTR
jgi:hypothetical protein